MVNDTFAAQVAKNNAKHAMKEIIVRYSSIDGASYTRTYTTLKGARKFAHEWIGAHPEIGTSYAVSFDGVGKITVSGATLAELFPERE